jgi:hypothetical protein
VLKKVAPEVWAKISVILKKLYAIGKPNVWSLNHSHSLKAKDNFFECPTTWAQMAHHMFPILSSDLTYIIICITAMFH